MYSEEDAAYDAWAERAREGALTEAAGIEDEHRLLDEPAMVAFMRLGGETVWINAYRYPRVIIETYPAAPDPHFGNLTMPGVVYEHPYARVDQAITAKFAERVFAHEKLGYRHARPEGGR